MVDLPSRHHPARCVRLARAILTEENGEELTLAWPLFCTRIARIFLMPSLLLRSPFRHSACWVPRQAKRQQEMEAWGMCSADLTPGPFPGGEGESPNILVTSMLGVSLLGPRPSPLP